MSTIKTYTTAEIAEYFGINTRTVRKHYSSIKQAYPNGPETIWKEGSDRYTEAFMDEVKDLRSSPLTTAQWIQQKKHETTTDNNIKPAHVDAIVENGFVDVDIVPATPTPITRSKAQSRLAQLREQNQALKAEIVEAIEYNADRDETEQMLMAIAIEAGKADGLKAFRAYRQARRETFEGLRAQLED